MNYTCPKCWRTSYNPNDAEEGYCGYCHKFTGRPHGDQRHSSSSTPAGQEGEMRMQPNDEEQQAQPEMPEVQREGISESLREVRWQRMERDHEQDVLAMQRSWVSPASDPIALPHIPHIPEYPSKYRYLSGATGMGIGLGITWTIALTSTAVQRYLSRDHAYMILYATAGFFFGWQVKMLVRWHREFKEHRAEMAKFWDDMKLDPKDNPFRK